MEPDLGFGFEVLSDAVSLADWCMLNPHIDDISAEDERSLAIAVRCRIMLEVSIGLLELARMKFVHGDLRASNIYLQVCSDGLVRARVSEYALVRPK